MPNHRGIPIRPFRRLGWLWGGEFLLADYRGWDRVQAAYGHLDLVRRLKAKPLSLIVQMMESQRTADLFGGPFAMLSRRRSASVSMRSLEAQAAIELEALAAPEMHRARESYCGRLVEGEPMRLDWSPLWRALLADLEARIEPPLIAAKFHAGMADTVAEAGAELARRQGCNAIVLCGGVFQNKLFLERVSEKVGAMGFKVLSPVQFPAGDGGIALGQAIRPVCARAFAACAL